MGEDLRWGFLFFLFSFPILLKVNELIIPKYVLHLTCNQSWSVLCYNKDPETSLWLWLKPFKIRVAYLVKDYVADAILVDNGFE